MAINACQSNFRGPYTKIKRKLTLFTTTGSPPVPMQLKVRTRPQSILQLASLVKPGEPKARRAYAESTENATGNSSDQIDLVCCISSKRAELSSF